MFGLSFGELLIIAVLALILLGPERLPEAAKTLGKGLRDLRRVTEDLKGQVEQEIYADDRRPAKPALVPPVPSSAAPAGPPPAATPENVPGLEAALVEPDAALPPNHPGAVLAAPPPAEPSAEPREGAPPSADGRPGTT